MYLALLGGFTRYQKKGKRMKTWHDALERQYRLSQLQISPRYWEYSEAEIAGMTDPEFSRTHKAAWIKAACSGECFFIEPELFEVIKQGAESLTSHIFQPDDILANHGIIEFPESQEFTHADRVFKAEGLGYHWNTDFSSCTYVYFNAADELHEVYGFENDGSENVFPPFLGSFFLFTSSRVTIHYKRSRLEAPRSTRRRLPEEVPDVRVTTLRRSENHPSESTSDREFNWRWWVRPHWRRLKQKTVPVVGYVKGPKDKPFKTRQDIFVVRR